MVINNLQVVGNTFTGTISRLALPIQYINMFSDSKLEIAGWFEQQDEMVLIDTVVVDDDKVYVNLNLTYVDTVSIALQIEDELLTKAFKEYLR